MSGASPAGEASGIPHAPPLPAPQALQRAREAANKFFGYQSPRAAAPAAVVSDRPTRGRPTFVRHVSLGTGNATASHRTGLEINTLAVNESGTHALIGGKEIFKTIKIEHGSCAEEINLRSAIRSNPRQASGKTRQIYSIDIADVAWAKGDFGDYVAAATSSGKIILYDLGHAGLQAAQLHEHFRQVHKVTFNPHRGNLLLSGSQDGTVRLWDVRDVRQASTLQSKRKYSGLSDGVRDVKWSPTEGVEFAFGTDSGWIQCWDMRNLKTAKVKLPAHNTTCNTIDWHPDGKHIVSASSDRTIRVWDFSSPKRQACDWEIRTPHPVFNARWRPPCESSLGKDNRARQCTQIVTAYDRTHPVLHVWDFRRPELPFREICPYPSAPTDLLWHSQDLLWTVGREGVFLQSDMQHTSKVIDKRNMQSLTLSSDGEIACFTQARRGGINPSLTESTPSYATLASDLSQSPSGNMFGRSWTDDSLDQAFLSLNIADGRAVSTGKDRASSFNTFVLTEQNSPTMKLDDVLLNRKSFRPPQGSAIGRLPMLSDIRLFGHFAQSYHFDLPTFSQGQQCIAGIDSVLSQNAAAASAVRQYRLAQTWDIARTAFVNHLREREASRNRTSKDVKPKQTVQPLEKLGLIARGVLKDAPKTAPHTPSTTRPLTMPAHLAVGDNSSDIPTPQAKPFTNGKPASNGFHALPDPDKEQLVLPPLLSSAVEEDGRPAESPSDWRLTAKNLDGLQKIQPNGPGTDSTDAVRRWSIQPKEPLNLELNTSNNTDSETPRLTKHDSEESFKFLDALSDSRGASFPSSYGSGSGKSTEALHMVSARPSRHTGRIDRPINGAAPADQSSAPGASGVNGGGEQRPPSSSIHIPASQKPDMADNILGIPSLAANKSRTEAALGLSPDLDSDSREYELSKMTTSRPTQIFEGRNVGEDPESDVRMLDERQRMSGRVSRPETAEETAIPIPDCFPTEDDLDVEIDKPFTVSSMVQELISHYASHADVQTAASLILLLTRLLPRTSPLGAQQTTAVALSYAETFTALGFTMEEIFDAFDSHIGHTVQTGLQPLELEAILSTYHEQLEGRQMYDEAVALRQLAYPAYPAVYDEALRDNRVDLECAACRQPIQPSGRRHRCEASSRNHELCRICGCVASPYEDSSAPTQQPREPTLLTACLLCGHGGHSACLRIWFGGRDGGCATPGCLCDCVDGLWRREKAARLEQQRRAKHQRRVKSDEWTARESKAAQEARTLLASGTKATNS